MIANTTKAVVKDAPAVFPAPAAVDSADKQFDLVIQPGIVKMKRNVWFDIKENEGFVNTLTASAVTLQEAKAAATAIEMQARAAAAATVTQSVALAAAPFALAAGLAM
ncbi:hypothetical protein B0T25DRAFT_563315 [Lasiosphaeria hispida]|uniref:Uncharacterized protein n=1 Tax=Lasiosphaeria hispida TaxID=260671 RepID=A0AAJ0HXB2_9PEZI|nr:hypothetical protein B0T25DRAFT_563315 [Lasiosphaeria hispida]